MPKQINNGPGLDGKSVLYLLSEPVALRQPQILTEYALHITTCPLDFQTNSYGPAVVKRSVQEGAKHSKWNKVS